MKKVILGLTLAIMAGPTLAHAGSYSVSQEGSVTIYRGHVPQISYDAYHYEAERKAKEKARRLKAKIKAQNYQLRQQQAELDQLAHKVDHLEERIERTRRPRYGRSYYGNNRFFGVNGFIGNRNFSGGTVLNVRKRRRRGY